MKKLKKVKNKVIKKIKINGKLIKECRELLEMTQAQLSNKIKSKAVYLSKAETNKASLPDQNKKLLLIDKLMVKKNIPRPIKFMKIIEHLNE